MHIRNRGRSGNARRIEIVDADKIAVFRQTHIKLDAKSSRMRGLESFQRILRLFQFQPSVRKSEHDSSFRVRILNGTN